MTEDQEAKDSQSDSGIKTFINKGKDKKSKAHRPLTKIILRRLPPSMTEEAFLEQVSPIPDHDHFYFAKPDPSLGNNVYSRAYINFVNVEDIYLFRDKFDGYVFLDEKGLEYVGIVEYAPFQRVPKKKKKKDPKCGTIESDPIYQDFLDNLNKDQETESQPKLEYSYPVGDGNDKKAQSTPLLEYLASRKQDKRSRDERRRRENDKRKMRIERKTKDGYIIKKCGDISEDDTCCETYEHYDYKHGQNLWFGDRKCNFKNRAKGESNLTEVKNAHGTDEFISTDSDWDSHFPALNTKAHNTFTLSSAKLLSNKKDTQESSQKSGGDTHFKEEDDIIEVDVKKIKPRDWEKDKSSVESKEDHVKSETKGTTFESKSYKDLRKPNANSLGDKRKPIEFDKKEGTSRDDDPVDDDKGFKKEKREKYKEFKDSPREQKSKKYSDTRKERIKQTDFVKSEKQAAISKIMSSDSKSKSINHDDIKPFTQLPQVKTDDLVKIIESMDKKVKLEETQMDGKVIKGLNDDIKPSTSIAKKDRELDPVPTSSKVRKISLESDDASANEESVLNSQKSIEDRGKSTEREGSEEKDKAETSDRRTERRIRNKDRPSLVIYQPGMGKFSKQRLAKEKESQPSTSASMSGSVSSSTTRTVSDSEKRDT